MRAGSPNDLKLTVKAYRVAEDDEDLGPILSSTTYGSPRTSGELTFLPTYLLTTYDLPSYGREPRPYLQTTTPPTSTRTSYSPILKALPTAGGRTSTHIPTSQPSSVVRATRLRLTLTQT